MGNENPSSFRKLGRRKYEQSKKHPPNLNNPTLNYDHSQSFQSCILVSYGIVQTNYDSCVCVCKALF